MPVRNANSGPFVKPTDFAAFAAGTSVLGTVDGGSSFAAVPITSIPGGLSVDSSVQLIALVDVPIGALVYVRSRGRSFQCVPVGAGELGGVGVSWKSIPETSSVAWLTQATWSIDGVNGNDDASGVDDAHALRTFAELHARLGGASWVWEQSVTIRVLSDCDGIVLDFEFPVTDLTCVIESVYPAPELSGAVTAFSPYVGNVSARLQLAGVADWSPWVNRRLRIVGGARDGAVLWVAQVNPNGAGSAVAAVLQGIKPDGPYNAVVSPPLVGDVFAADVLFSVPYLRVRAKTPDPSTSNTIPAVRVKGLSIGVLEHQSVSASRAGCWVFGCYVHYVYAWSFVDAAGGAPVLKLLGCRLNPDVIGNVTTDCCLISQTDRQVLKVVGHWFSGHDLVQGPYLLITGPAGFLEVSNGSFGIQEITSTGGGGAIRFQNNGRAYFASGFYGQSSIAIVAINMGGGGASLMWSGPLPTVTGALGDIQIAPFTAAVRPVMSWAATQGIWADGGMQGTAQLGAGGFVDVAVPALLAQQSVMVQYRTPGVSAGVLSVPLANRTAVGFRIVGAAADTTSTVDWFVGPLGVQQFIGKL